MSLACGGPPVASATAHTPSQVEVAPPTAQNADASTSAPDPVTQIATGETVALEIPSYLPAVLWVPGGSTRGPRPVVIATHGAWDNPESYCPFWQRLVGERAFVLCTRGRKIEPTAFFYPNHFFIDEENTAALTALRARFGSRVADGPALYAGYSQGAIHGAPLLQMRPEQYPRAVFIEGGALWTAASAAKYRRGGGQRLLFVCGTTGCKKGATRAVKLLTDAGVEVQFIWVPSAGHDYPPQMAELVAGKIQWMVGDDSRWSSEASLR